MRVCGTLCAACCATNLGCASRHVCPRGARAAGAQRPSARSRAEKRVRKRCRGCAHLRMAARAGHQLAGGRVILRDELQHLRRRARVRHSCVAQRRRTRAARQQRAASALHAPTAACGARARPRGAPVRVGCGGVRGATGWESASSSKQHAEREATKRSCRTAVVRIPTGRRAVSSARRFSCALTEPSTNFEAQSWRGATCSTLHLLCGADACAAAACARVHDRRRLAAAVRRAGRRAASRGSLAARGAARVRHAAHARRNARQPLGRDGPLLSRGRG